MSMRGTENMFDRIQVSGGHSLRVDRRREDTVLPAARALLGEYGLIEPDAGAQDVFARTAACYSDDNAHAQRLYEYMSQSWFMPSPRILRSAVRGLSASGYISSVGHGRDAAQNLWAENAGMAAQGAGIANDWSNMNIDDLPRRTRGNMTAYLNVMDAMRHTILNNGRPHDSVCYLSVSHPAVLSFLEWPGCHTGDDAPSGLHRGVLIPDAFMRAVDNDEGWMLKSPGGQGQMAHVRARDIWDKVLSAPDMTVVFIDSVLRHMTDHQKLAGLHVRTAGPEGAFMQPTGDDHHGQPRTAPVFRGALNLATFEEWSDQPRFIHDVMQFLDNVISGFIKSAPDRLIQAKYAAMRGRAVGLSTVGFHSFLQTQNVAFGQVKSRVWNARIFEHIAAHLHKANHDLAVTRGACPDARDYGILKRFSGLCAQTPAREEALLCGNVTYGAGPQTANAVRQRIDGVDYKLFNPVLARKLQDMGLNPADIWADIFENNGSVAHIQELTSAEKAVFKTAVETPAEDIIHHAAVRKESVDQGEAVALPQCSPDKRHTLLQQGWQSGLKSIRF